VSGTPRIICRSNSNISAEQAHDARSRAWLYVFECFNRRKEQEGGCGAAPDDAKGSKHDRATPIVPE